MGRNERMAELLVNVLEGTQDFLEVPNESMGSFFRHIRVPGFGGAVNMSSTSCLSTSDVTWVGRVRRAWPFRVAMYTDQCSCLSSVGTYVDHLLYLEQQWIQTFH